MYVVKSKVKEYAKKKKIAMGSDAVEELSKEVARIIDRAAVRAKENRRNTIKSRDI